MRKREKMKETKAKRNEVGKIRKKKNKVELKEIKKERNKQREKKTINEK